MHFDAPGFFVRFCLEVPISLSGATQDPIRVPASHAHEPEALPPSGPSNVALSSSGASDSRWPCLGRAIFASTPDRTVRRTPPCHTRVRTPAGQGAGARGMAYANPAAIRKHHGACAHAYRPCSVSTASLCGIVRESVLTNTGDLGP